MDPLVRRRSHHAWLLMALGLLVLVVTYFVAVRTRVGQTWGDEAYLSRLVEAGSLRSVERGLLESIDTPVLLCFGIVLIVIAGLRRNWLAATVVTGAFVGAILSAEALKALLPRPELAVAYESLMGSKEALNTYPSGHATLATALAMGALILVPPRLRPYVAIAGSTLTIAVSTSVVAAGWHRPSDAIGGIALALTWMSAGAAMTLARRGVPAHDRGTLAPVLIVDALLLAGVVLATVTSYLSSRDDRISDIVSPATFPILVTAVAAWGALAGLLLLRALRGVDTRGASLLDGGGPPSRVP